MIGEFLPPDAASARFLHNVSPVVCCAGKKREFSGVSAICRFLHCRSAYY
jgi:hypothetical protein